jgi:phosphopantetheinyl transferase (holo-ACP synthase)
MDIIKIHDTETGEITERNMTADEMEQRKLNQENAKIIAKQLAAKEAAKQAVLDKLGLTADEVSALLG